MPTIREIAKQFSDETCRNCGLPAPLYVGCVLGPPPGTCGECSDLTDDEKIALAKAGGVPIGDPD